MQITVNGDQQVIGAASSLQDLLESLQMTNGRIAVELNGEIVPKSSFQRHVLRDGDKIEIVQAIGGG
ncbi:MAG: sulfur carrier protein ThiS [Gammaproteobacteria bacterium]|nr:sulfur carrier protein ThiS [Gammaproteobacteria bacterium]MDD9897234.1 sulfur carrier protein ThiS [Gammaproteobacteria bacterium]MDD9959175.1 sulfur carrier protein ThiS [Gammaproteobacteria bacterium]